MRAVLLGLAVALATLGAAGATTYRYFGVDLIHTVNHNTCTIGPCLSYSTTAPFNKITGGFSTAAPLPPDSCAEISGSVLNFAFTDGLTLISSTDPKTRTVIFQVCTDAAGNIRDQFIILQDWYTLTPAAATGDANERQNFMKITTSGDTAGNNLSCELGLVVISGFAQPGACSADPEKSSDGSVTDSKPGAGSGFLIVPDVPTLSDWAEAFGALLLGGAGLVLIRPRTGPARSRARMR